MLNIPFCTLTCFSHGILACRPEGIIVYSTCTLSPVQNDGVIQATLERIWTNTKIELAVIDIGHLADTFREIYNFADNTRFGQLVIPNVAANFGPMYICKLKRINQIQLTQMLSNKFSVKHFNVEITMECRLFQQIPLAKLVAVVCNSNRTMMNQTSKFNL